MVRFKVVGAHVGAHLDRLADVYEQSDRVPLTLERFVHDLVTGRDESDVSRMGLIEAGIAVGVIRGMALAAGIDFVQLAAAVLGPQGAS